MAHVSYLTNRNTYQSTTSCNLTCNRLLNKRNVNDNYMDMLRVDYNYMSIDIIPSN